jgi:plasmid stabilization system protein ParE
VVMQNCKIRWDAEPLTAFKAAIAWMRETSPRNAGKAKEETLEQIDNLLTRREIHSPVRKQPMVQAFEFHRFRISYQVKEEEMTIARFRHASQQPKIY